MVFALGVVVPSLIAAMRLISIGIANSHFFGDYSFESLDPADDLGLRITAVVITVAVAVLVTMIVIEAVRGRWLIAGTVFAAIAVVPMCLNWYVLV